MLNLIRVDEIFVNKILRLPCSKHTNTHENWIMEKKHLKLNSSHAYTQVRLKAFRFHTIESWLLAGFQRAEVKLHTIFMKK